MPRAEFNVTADVFKGGGTLTPYQYDRTITGRLVPIGRELSQAPNAMFFDHYFTYSGTSLSAGDDVSAFPVVSEDLFTSDILEIPPGSSNYFTVFKVEIIRPRRAGLLPYRRAYLQNLLV